MAKALSVQQPWAWLIANGYKCVENRSWPTNVRGRVLIHAGKKFDREGYFWVRQNFPSIPLPDSGDLQFGGVVGAATLTDCVSRRDDPWFFGPFGFVFSDAEPLPFAPVRGQLGFFDADSATGAPDHG